MAEETIKAYDVPAVRQNGDRYDREYRRTPMWDVEKGDFVLDGTHKVAEDTGRHGYMMWCLKMSLTERFKCLAYCGSIGNQLGVEMEVATYDDDHAMVESMIKRTITEALMVNPRTIDVGGFEFEWEGDTISGSCTVHAHDMDDFTLKF